MKSNDSIALAMISGYLIAVGYHKQAENLFKKIGSESRFLKFAIALLVLNYSIESFLPKQYQNGAKIFMWVSIILSSPESGNVFDSINKIFGENKL